MSRHYFLGITSPITMSTSELTKAKLHHKRRIEGSYKQRLERIHGDVMQSFFDAYRRLEKYVTDIEPEKELISERLKILDKLIETFKPNPVAWPQKFEARLLKVIRDARSVGDLDFEVQKLIDDQEDEFSTLLHIYRTLQPTTPASERE